MAERTDPLGGLEEASHLPVLTHAVTVVVDVDGAASRIRLRAA